MGDSLSIASKLANCNVNLAAFCHDSFNHTHFLFETKKSKSIQSTDILISFFYLASVEKKIIQQNVEYKLDEALIVHEFKSLHITTTHKNTQIFCT